MEIEPTKISDVLLIEPTIYKDDRGYFYESFNEKITSTLNINPSRFVQDNISVSNQGVLRGLHYQVNFPQGKLVQVMDGVIFDVAVDLRENSKTFGQWVSVTLNSKDNQQLWIPAGFAHGFYVLSPIATVFYKVTDIYSPKDERTILWNDATLKIDWPLLNDESPIISSKDQAGNSFSEAEYFLK